MFEGVVVVGFVTGVFLSLLDNEFHEAISAIWVVEVLLAKSLELGTSDIPVVGGFSAKVVTDRH